jgi:riboflavin transporter FmnP
LVATLIVVRFSDKGMVRISTSKGISFIALMAALGNVLSFISIQLSPIIPQIPLGPVNFSLALDLSHLATFIAAFVGGPIVGGLVGLVGGSVAAFQFGFSQGNILTGICLPIGKAMTGIAAGFIFKLLKSGRVKMMVSTVLSYIPEAAFTAIIFIYLYPAFYGFPQALAMVVAAQVLVKAFVEMLIMGAILSFLAGSKGFKSFTSSIWT